MFVELFVFVSVFGLNTVQNVVKTSYIHSVSYTLWAEDKTQASVNIKLPNVQINFYNLMVLAATEHPGVYNFTSTVHPKYGHYVTGIWKWTEMEKDGRFWMIYILDEKPDINEKPKDEFLSEFGVDFIRVKPKKHYLFWFKKLEPFTKIFDENFIEYPHINKYF